MRKYIAKGLFVLGITPILVISTPLKADAKQFNLLPYNILELNTIFSKETVKLLDSYSIVSDDNKLVDSTEDKENRITTYGLISYKDRTITIRDEIPRSKKDKVLYHEFGHLVDYTYSISDRQEVADLMYEESSNATKMTNTINLATSSCEFFAESVSLAVSKPEEMQKLMPKTYEYIKNLNL